MEEEDEEARGLLSRGPDGAGSDAPAAPGALPALCDPSRLAHRLLVLLLMCFLGFGERPGRAGGQVGGRHRVWLSEPGISPQRGRRASGASSPVASPFLPVAPRGGVGAELASRVPPAPGLRGVPRLAAHPGGIAREDVRVARSRSWRSVQKACTVSLPSPLPCPHEIYLCFKESVILLVVLEVSHPPGNGVGVSPDTRPPRGTR